nr:MAG TPA: HNH endonuclease [Caudoviricetes sp.]
MKNNMYSTLEEIKEYFFKNSENHRYIERYFKLIEYYINLEVFSDYEKHHIFSRCLEKSKLTVKLPYKAHYLAHYMLAKIFGGKLWYAFNIMSRVIYTKNIKFSSILYEQKKRSNKTFKRNRTFAYV